uniref:Putative secreted protein n=1 Tax=Anopheles marajoara TaxID=58244 RepID=A0A2M4CD87_9DIPT
MEGCTLPTLLMLVVTVRSVSSLLLRKNLMKLHTVASNSHVHSALRCTGTRAYSACITGNAIQRIAAVIKSSKEP